MLEQQGLPTRTYKAGESFSVKQGQVHEGMNHGKTPVKILVTLVAEKGKPVVDETGAPVAARPGAPRASGER